MPTKSSYITVKDQFCGAGGSSQGAKRALQKVGIGAEGIRMAMNHWKLAIETHNTNFPDTLHDCTDISACDPRRYPSTDILITSPECTNHSLAKGVKIVKQQMDMFSSGVLDAAAERSRATMWDVCRFTEYHKYNIIIVENVVDARKWIMWDAWILSMDLLGYKHRCVYHNSMHHHPTPQSRDRMYVVFWKKGNTAPNLDFNPEANCQKCGKDVLSVQTWKDKRKPYGKYKQQYVYCCPSCSSIVEPYYHAAFNCIDWTDVGTKIADRKIPLSVNTVRRIQYGLKKYGKSPYILTQKYHGEDFKQGSKSIIEALRTQVGEQAHGILNPFLIDDKQSTGINFRVRSVTETVNTIHTDPRVKMLIPPFIAKLEHSRQDNVKISTQEFSTQTTRQSHALVVPPFITVCHGTSNAIHSTDGINTIGAGGIHSGIVSGESWNSFLSSYYGGSHCTKHITEETGTVRTGDCHSILNYNDQEPILENCYYRMLKPHEIKMAMAFEPDYIVLGSGRWQVKQLGNAVTPPAMEWLMDRAIESLS